MPQSGGSSTSCATSSFVVFVLVCACLLPAKRVQAYRPFTGTDGDVAEQGEFELELGPVQLLRQQHRDYLLSPVTVLNLGIFSRTELVVDFVGDFPLAADRGDSRYRVQDTDVFLKFLLRPGVLQKQSGPSIALEAGPLTPGIGGQPGFGAAANLIVSERWEWLIVHLNSEATLSRQQLQFSWSNSLISEFRFNEIAWPVTELRWERVIGSGASVYSALAGGIWRVCVGIDLDAAAIVESVGGSPAFEARLGFTWAFQVWESPR
jgi:hypothetical protein